MPLNWTYERCGELGCDGTTDCPGFPTIKDRINIAQAAYEEYATSDGTSVIDFALDVLLFAQSEHAADRTLLPRLAKQAFREWRAHRWRPSRHNSPSPAASFHCKMCGDPVLPADMRDHLAGHSVAAESAIDDPSQFFEKRRHEPKQYGAVVSYRTASP